MSVIPWLKWREFNNINTKLLNETTVMYNGDESNVTKIWGSYMIPDFSYSWTFRCISSINKEIMVGFETVSLVNYPVINFKFLIKIININDQLMNYEIECNYENLECDEYYQWCCPKQYDQLNNEGAIMCQLEKQWFTDQPYENKITFQYNSYKHYINVWINDCEILNSYYLLDDIRRINICPIVIMGYNSSVEIVSSNKNSVITS